MFNFKTNKMNVDKVTFEFSQKAHCMSNDEYEEIQIEIQNDLGRCEDGEFFFVIKTEQFSLNNIDELKDLFHKIELAVQTFKTKEDEK